MYCPCSIWILVRLQNIDRLQNLAADFDFKLVKFRNSESIVIASPVPLDQVNCISSPRSQFSKFYRPFSRFLRNPNACAAVAESTDTLPIGAMGTFRVKKCRGRLHDNDQSVTEICGQTFYKLNCAYAGRTAAVPKVHLRCGPTDQIWELSS